MEGKGASFKRTRAVSGPRETGYWDVTRCTLRCGGEHCLGRPSREVCRGSREPTSLRGPFAVQNLQDVLGNLLDGMAGIVSLLSHPKQYDQPLVALVAARLLLHAVWWHHRTRAQSRPSSHEHAPTPSAARCSGTARRRTLENGANPSARWQHPWAQDGGGPGAGSSTWGMGKCVAYCTWRGWSYRTPRVPSSFSLAGGFTSFSMSAFSGDGLPFPSQGIVGENS